MTLWPKETGIFGGTPKLTDSFSDRVEILWTGKSPDSFVELLQWGFLFRARDGATIREVVCDGLGVENEYLDGRVNTVFLNGRPIDNVDAAPVHQDAIVSLSASMPGFVGAAFRKGGFYAPMRAAISHIGDDAIPSGNVCDIRIRLYNLVARELGPLLLERGVNFLVQHLRGFLDTRSEKFWSACRTIMVNNKEVSPRGLMKFLDALDPSSDVELCVRVKSL